MSFAAPPVSEVALGVQIAPQPRLGGIQAAGLWDKWRDAYPHLSEMPALPPLAEPGAQSGPWIQIAGSPGVRLWFISDSQDHLIQLQPDRLIVNWRQQSGAPYPRFPEIMSRFGAAWDAVAAFVAEDGQKLHVQQIEVTYINAIHASPADALRGFDGVLDGADRYARINANFARSVEHDSWAAGIEETGISSGATDSGPNVTLSLSVRAMPHAQQDPLPSLNQAHDLIVESFSRITTDPMHHLWRTAQ